jgi:hypothetical protein
LSEAFGEVAERTVENATFPVVADPGEGEVVISAINAGGGEVNGVAVEREEHTDSVPGEGAELVELFGEAEGGSRVCDQRLCGSSTSIAASCTQGWPEK